MYCEAGVLLIITCISSLSYLNVKFSVYMHALAEFKSGIVNICIADLVFYSKYTLVICHIC